MKPAIRRVAGVWRFFSPPAGVIEYISLCKFIAHINRWENFSKPPLEWRDAE